MHCLTCHYDLSHLTEHRCPECGRTFDPSDPSTFFSRQSRSRRKRILAILIGITYVLSFIWSFTWIYHTDPLFPVPGLTLKLIKFSLGSAFFLTIIVWLGVA